jgi:hypothetical protein
LNTINVQQRDLNTSGIKASNQKSSNKGLEGSKLIVNDGFGGNGTNEGGNGE